MTASQQQTDRKSATTALRIARPFLSERARVSDSAGGAIERMSKSSCCSSGSRHHSVQRESNAIHSPYSVNCRFGSLDQIGHPTGRRSDIYCQINSVNKQTPPSIAVTFSPYCRRHAVQCESRLPGSSDDWASHAG